ncbi:uncharacterized protein LOC112452567 [Temnothorax curvispinosus]|uniref:Uncharacterized protein LOC112452567 n=1 Tax=Temnothorax curvispinosus TaxID=300111 RepID=A0A6J1PGH0_9HYME|nr:uncharacterized protein LOC112452567 [Temnothorax curvispinosus]
MTRPELLNRTTTKIEGRTKFMRRTDVAIFGDSPITCLDTEGGLISDRLRGFHYFERRFYPRLFAGLSRFPKAGEIFHTRERMDIRTFRIFPFLHGMLKCTVASLLIAGHHPTI